MKSNSYTGVKLDQFKDIKVGPYQSEVVYGSPSYEPYPDLSKEDIIYKGRFENLSKKPLSWVVIG